MTPAEEGERWREERSTGIEAAAKTLGDPEALALLSALISIAPTNREEPARGLYEKPNYLRAVERIVRAGREIGFATRIYDPVVAGDVPGEFHGLPRPNAILEFECGAPRTVLVLTHYDVVPVPEEQRSRWKSPPFSLSSRGDGRLYGRGANDDLGSGVVASLFALKPLIDEGTLRTNVRILCCCDEETGGEGGIEAIKAHDERLPPESHDRILRADVALIPDGSPHTTAGSSGVAFLDATFDGPVPLASTLEYARVLGELDDLARSWKSGLPSGDYPDHGAPEPVITGRATLTNLDVTALGASAGRACLGRAHAESAAANQIARSVTLAFDGSPEALALLKQGLPGLLPAPFRLEPAGPSGAALPPGSWAVSVVGESGHGGYPHRARNPVPASIDLLRAAGERGWIDMGSPGSSSLVVDLRLPPEMELSAGLGAASARVRNWAARNSPHSRLAAPPARCRPGYCVPIDDPMVRRLATAMKAELGEGRIFGEYGGTDASALRGLTTPAGDPLPALVFGAMDREARIHEAEESVDPRVLAGILRVIRRFLKAL